MDIYKDIIETRLCALGNKRKAESALRECEVRMIDLLMQDKRSDCLKVNWNILHKLKPFPYGEMEYPS